MDSTNTLRTVRTSNALRMATLALALTAVAAPPSTAEAWGFFSKGKPGVSRSSSTTRSSHKRGGFKRAMGKLFSGNRINKSTRMGKFMRALTHRPKVVSADQAAKMIKPGDNVYMPVGHPVAGSVVDALAARAKAANGGLDAKKPVKLVGLANTVHPKAFDRAGKVVPKAVFIGGNSRDAIMAGRGSFVPVYLSRVPRSIREGKIKVDKALVQVSKPDMMGFVTLGTTAATMLAAIDKAKVVIGEINPNVPRTNGATKIHISRLDAVVHSDKPIVGMPPTKIGKVEQAIAKHIVKLVPKNPTLQFGIGAIPDAVAGQLAKAGRKDLRVYSEMISDGVMGLVKAGAVRGKVKYSFAMGTEGFVGWMNNNRKLRSYTTDHINDPSRIGKIKNMVAVNSALRVDLNGQINAQYIKDSWYSGVGGQVDFMRGAMASKGGRAILALPSTSSVSDGKGGRKLVSRIVPRLGEGDVVTTSMHDVQYVVTEHGTARLDGKTAVERARALIKVADPQFRGDLTRSLDSQIAKRRSVEQKRHDARRAAKAARQ